MKAHFGYTESSSLATVSQGTDPAGMSLVTLRAHSQQHQEESKACSCASCPSGKYKMMPISMQHSSSYSQVMYLAQCDYAPQPKENYSSSIFCVFYDKA